ncbi:MAG: phospholipase D-like domain-containing protein [Gammaproteobacteria bacterium]|nr:phospholipase D-like domain-containing protein [Gammaproteobacteria bacterium]
MSFALVSSHWLSLHGLAIVVGLLVYVVTSHVQQQRRHPSAAIGWVLFMLLVPYVALPLYLLFGTRKLPHAGCSSPNIRVSNLQDDKSTWPAQLIAALGQPPLTTYRSLRIHADGFQSLHALLEVIDGAQHTLDVCTFILGRDALGGAVGARLMARVRDGVQVRLLLDGVGRLLGGTSDLPALERAGVQIGLFMPPIHSPMKGRTNLRNHRKLVVADAGHAAERLWSGGRNLAAEYFEDKGGRPAWRDLSFDLQGHLARQAANLFQQDWIFATGAKAGAARPILKANISPITTASGEPVAQIIASGPDQADDTVHALLVSAAYHASKRIALVSPYVVLDNALLLGLTMAARRGVQVDLLLPLRSNHRLADIARHRSLRALTGAGVRIWLAPQMLHAKLAIFDDVLALAGSANLDSRSLFLNYELMVAFESASDVMRYTTWFDLERSSACLYVSQPPGLWRDLGEGLVLWLGFQL